MSKIISAKGMPIELDELIAQPKAATVFGHAIWTTLDERLLLAPMFRRESLYT
jgi:hypothetical protein